MTDKFPTFGILFQTTQIAAKDLGISLFSMLVIGFGFIYSTTIIFGDDNDYFRTAFKSFLILFYMMAGQNNEIGVINKTHKLYVVSRILYLVFLLLFYFGLLKTLKSIIITRYKYLRSMVELENEANSRIEKLKTQERNQAFLNLIFCRKPNQSKASKKDLGSQLKFQNMTMCNKFRLNLQELFKEDQVLNREAKDKVLSKMKASILKERAKKQKERLAYHSKERVGVHKSRCYDMLLYAFFLTTFLVILLLQLKITDNFDNNYLMNILVEYPAAYGDEYYKNETRRLYIDYSEDSKGLSYRNMQDDSSNDTNSSSSSDSSSSDITELYFVYDDIAETAMLQEWVSSVSKSKINSTSCRF